MEGALTLTTHATAALLLDPDADALAALAARARGRSGPLSPAALARHVLAVTPGAGAEVRSAALEALCRRAASALARPRPSVRPDGPAGSGRFLVQGPDGGRRYRAWLFSVEPLQGSCDCKDFARASLGLCKHLFAALAHLERAPDHAPRTQAARPPPLRWSPLRPLTGLGDWLARVELRTARAPAGAGLSELDARRWFAPASRGRRALKDSFPGQPERRLELVQALRRLGAEPALDTLLEAEETALLRSRADGWTPQALDAALEGLLLPLSPFQRAGVARFLTRGRLVLADESGLGKTAQAIAACHALFTAGKVERGLVLAPASHTAFWLGEWARFSDVPVAVVEGPLEARAHAFAMKRGFLIASEEQMLRDLPLMQRFVPGIVVLDEAQPLESGEPRHRALVKQLKPARRLVLTSAPVEERVAELASLVQWVDDHALEPRWRLGPLDAVTLRERVAPCLLRRTRAQVEGQLPAADPGAAPGLSPVAVEAELEAAPLGELALRFPPAASAQGERVGLAALAPLLAQATVRPLEGGRVALELPAPAAAALAQLFAGLAQALGQPEGGSRPGG